MDIRYKLFPYPVLSYMTDDYVDSVFRSEVTVEYDPNAVTISASIYLDNEELLALLESEVVEYICHIECSETTYRRVLRSKAPDVHVRIGESMLKGKVNICTFIVAKTDMDEYRNRSFNPDYDNRGFHVDKGSILGFAEQTNVFIDKELEEFTKIPSIFVILRKQVEAVEPVEINLDSDRIMLKLHEQEYIAYQKIIKRFDLLQASHAMLIFPALVYTIDRIKSDGCDHYDEYRWFRVIRKKLREHGVELNEAGITQEDSFKLAQLLLNMPSYRALTSVASYDLAEEDSE